jgi:hypothetical protein
VETSPYSFPERKKKSLFMLPFNTNGYIRRYRVDEKSNILFFDIVGKEFYGGLFFGAPAI